MRRLPGPGFAENNNRLVLFDVRDEFVVVHGVYKEMRLRRGKVVLCIYNESPNFYGRDPKTDTASEVVERTTEN